MRKPSRHLGLLGAALYVAGRAVEPMALIADYSRQTSRPLEPFPVGLMMIAGDAHARRGRATG